MNIKFWNWDRFRIDVRVRQEVTAINPAEKTVTVHALDSGKVYTETYDKLLLAPGAKPTVPALSGVDSERVFTLRTVEDTLRIRRLDVYKRQGLMSKKDDCMEEQPGWYNGQFLDEVGFCCDFICRYPMAVSYTHLDVYKRQDLPLAEPGMPAYGHEAYL